MKKSQLTYNAEIEERVPGGRRFEVHSAPVESGFGRANLFDVKHGRVTVQLEVSALAEPALLVAPSTTVVGAATSGIVTETKYLCVYMLRKTFQSILCTINCKVNRNQPNPRPPNSRFFQVNTLPTLVEENLFGKYILR